MRTIILAVCFTVLGFLLSLLFTHDEDRAGGRPRFQIASFKSFDSIWDSPAIIIQGEDGYEFSDARVFQVAGALVKTVSVVDSRNRNDKVVVCIFEKISSNSIKITIIGDRDIVVTPTQYADYSLKVESDGGISTCVYTRI